MCVCVSIVSHPESGTSLADTAGGPLVSDVTVPLVQEAVFYDLKQETVLNLITAVVENCSDAPVDVCFAHEEAVTMVDLRQTLSDPSDNPHTGALAALLSEVVGPNSLFFMGPSPEHDAYKHSLDVEQFSVPGEDVERQFRDTKPFACVGFGPLVSAPKGVYHIIRFGVTIRKKAFSRLVRAINGTGQYFYDINGPAIVLDDIRYSHLTRAPEAAKRVYTPIFDGIVSRNHIPIQRYEILTFDVQCAQEHQIRYNRGLAEAQQLLHDYRLTTGPLGELNVNAWASQSERFVILRGSVASKGGS